jgi:glucose-1-phosphate adenylyltransferase
MPNAQIGRYSRVRRAIIDTNVRVPESSVIGFDADDDRSNGYHITEGGIVVVSGGQPAVQTQQARSSE